MRDVRSDIARSAAPGEPGPRRTAARWIATGALAAGLSLLIASAFAPCDGVRAGQELRVLTSAGYPPFEYYGSDGTLAGFDIDIARALCDVLLVRCVFIDVPFEETIPDLVAGRGDAIVASMTITAERKKLVAFTNHYYRTPMQFVARQGFDRPITAEGLEGLKIGVEPETFNERYARQNFAGEADIVQVAGTQEDLQRALIDGKVDLILSDTLAIWKFINSAQGRPFAFVGEPIYGNEDIAIAVRMDDEALRRRLNAAITRIRLDGTYQKINAKYYPFSIY